MKRLLLLFTTFLIPILQCHSGDKDVVDNSCILNFNLNRYLGTWYEIARYPHSFEKNLQGVKAKYTLMADGNIKVENSGYQDSLGGPLKKTVGKAKPAGDPSKGHLKVSFFLWFYADYYIMDLDTVNYQYALVGSSSDKYLWILARSPFIADTTVQMLYEKAAMRGYDTTRLERILHKAPLKIDPLKAI